MMLEDMLRDKIAALRKSETEALRAMYLDGLGRGRRTPEQEAWLRDYAARFDMGDAQLK